MKRSLNDLAIFGGPPCFDEVLHVGRPNIGNRRRFMERLNDILDRRWLTNNGHYVQEFEARVSELLGVRHCVAMCNGTVALEIAARAVGLAGEVIVPSFTFVATAHALLWQQITPVFCDIDPCTHKIDPNKVEALITPRTTGIIGVHLWGEPCDLVALADIARRRNLKLVWDAAHAFGCSHQGGMIGNSGMVEVFSFHATKFFNSFEGGAITTNDDALAEKIRLMTNFGFSGHDNVIYIGTNGKMTEVCAAMGISGLETLDDVIEINRQNYNLYRRCLADLPGIRVYTYDESQKRNYHYIVLEIEEDANQISRDNLMKVLHAENVLARRYFYPGCHRMEPYRSYFPHAGLLLPETEKLVKRVLSLPTGETIGSQEIEKVCAIIRSCVAHGAEITNRLRALKSQA